MSAKKRSGKRVYTVYKSVPLDRIEPDVNQPRKKFNDETLHELGASFEKSDPYQAPIARPHPVKKGHYLLTIGERRWRAARLAGKRTMVIGIRKNDTEDPLIIALKENFHREDLDPVDAAHALHRLREKLNISWAGVAKAVKKSLPWVQDRVSLIEQPATVQRLVSEGRITLKAARTFRAIQKRHGARPQAIVRLAQKEARGEKPLAAESSLHDSSRKEIAIAVRLPQSPVELLRRLAKFRHKTRSAVLTLRAFREQPGEKQRAALNTLGAHAKELLHRDFRMLAKALRKFVLILEEHGVRPRKAATQK